MSGFEALLVASAASLGLVIACLALAASRSRRRWLDEPTDLLPLLDEDPLSQCFDEAERLLRGDADPDIAAIYDRRRLQPYEAEFRTAQIRRLTRRLERLQS